MKRTLAIAITLGVAGITSCEKKPEATPPTLNVTVAPVIQKDVFVMRTWVGLLDGYQNAEIRAQVTGYLTTQNYKEGSVVKKGSVLFTIDQRPFQAALAQAQADYAKAVAQAQLSQITLDRQTQLYKTKVISQQEYDTSYQDTQAAVATVAAAQANVQSAQINLAYCTIVAPFDGIAGVAQAQIGDLVGPGGSATVLTQMSQVNPIKVNFSITEQEYLNAYQLLQRLQNTPSENLEGKLTLKLADGSPYGQPGKFDFVNRQVNASTGTIQITALFPNDDDLLRPGLFARVTAPTDEIKGALLVPQVALVELQGSYMISVLGANNEVVTLPVAAGPVEGPNQVVTPKKAGTLKAGMKVIVGGVEKVRSGMKVNPQAAPSPSATPGAAPAGTPKGDGAAS